MSINRMVASSQMRRAPIGALAIEPSS